MILRLCQDQRMGKIHLTRIRRFTVISVISLTIALMYFLASPPMFGRSQADVFDQVWETVDQQFFDPNFNGVDWRAMRQKYGASVRQASSRAEAAEVINQMLAELKTSHTHFYTPDEPAYYQLLGIFLPRDSDLQEQAKQFLPDGKPQYVGIGMFTAEANGETFVRAVLDGSPAAEAGLQAGDRILSVDNQPFQPIQSFAEKADKPVQVLIQRSSEPQSQETITITPKQLDGISMFLDALKASVETIDQEGHRIGYIHVWSYAGDQYQEQLETELLSDRLKEAEALVLDLREGWGGAVPDYLNLFNPRSLTMAMVQRDGDQYRFSSAWSKPTVMLINEGSRSGKEILAYGFRKHQLGTIVGAKTPGAVVGGRAFLMRDGSLLYLAVADVFVDGERLEGVGVVPDINVPQAIEYRQGKDLQKEQAVTTAVSRLAVE